MFKKLISLLKQYKRQLAMLAVAVAGALGYAYLMGFFNREHFGLSQTSKELVMFSMPGCGHCEKLQPTWDLLKTNYGNTAHIEIVEVSSSEKPELVEQYGITSFPTVLALKAGAEVDKYDGDRSYEDLVRWMNYHISNN